MIKPIVLKIGGNEIDDPNFLHHLALYLQQSLHPTIIVHGGGKEISNLQQRLGITPKYLSGLRVSDAESLNIVQMVLCGVVNPRIVQTLQSHGLDAQGMSGVDLGLIRTKKLIHPDGDLGYVGEPVAVRADVLQVLLNGSIIPVIAPLCYGDDGIYNVNADHVAGAVAKAVDAEKVVFLTNVDGISANGELLQSISSTEINSLIANETIYGGMIPKAQTAQHLVESGIPQVMITNLSGLKTHSGTTIVHTQPIGELV